MMVCFAEQVVWPESEMRRMPSYWVRNSDRSLTFRTSWKRWSVSNAAHYLLIGCFFASVFFSNKCRKMSYRNCRTVVFFLWRLWVASEN